MIEFICAFLKITIFKAVTVTAVPVFRLLIRSQNRLYNQIYKLKRFTCPETIMRMAKVQK